jgi:hypothetical protein
MKKVNNDVFSLYLSEIQNHLANTWRISPETVQEFGQIANFQATHHSMWLQAKRDPAKEWLQLSYCDEHRIYKWRSRSGLMNGRCQ